MLAGFSDGLLDAAIMRLMDVLLALPTLLLAVAIVAVLGPGLEHAMLAVAIVQLPAFVRLTRAAVRAERRREYVSAARMVGAGRIRLMFLTVLPNCMAPLIVQASLAFSTAILDTAALGFLGLGAQPPTPEWGTMLADALQFVQSAWWVVTFPGLAILLTVARLQPDRRRAARRARPPAEAMSLLEVRNLRVTFDTERGPHARRRRPRPRHRPRRRARPRRRERLRQDRSPCWP